VGGGAARHLGAVAGHGAVPAWRGAAAKRERRLGGGDDERSCWIAGIGAGGDVACSLYLINEVGGCAPVNGRCTTGLESWAWCRCDLCRWLVAAGGGSDDGGWRWVGIALRAVVTGARTSDFRLSRHGGQEV
jgi:hypothetical protein